jgi:HEAT repeat protein
MLRGRQKRTQLLALMAAQHLGPQGAEAAPFVEPLLADEDSWLRGAAAAALKAIRGEEPAN